ncbi:MAG: hypothetical protein RLN87_03340 [Parasphingopyxis sp.]|uniref:hypothetical protein n=1 Tax=Parasphingopyxis sp. TaxID=1920299 RepID=UPI0032ED948D
MSDEEEPETPGGSWKTAYDIHKLAATKNSEMVHELSKWLLASLLATHGAAIVALIGSEIVDVLMAISFACFVIGIMCACLSSVNARKANTTQVDYALAYCVSLANEGEKAQPPAGEELTAQYVRYMGRSRMLDMISIALFGFGAALGAYAVLTAGAPPESGMTKTLEFIVRTTG